jgi:amidase
MNGIVGFKPTVGMVSRSRVVPISPSQDTIGPMTATVEGAAMMMEALAGTDPSDDATAEADERRGGFLEAARNASLDGVRLGVLRWAEADDPREQAVFEEALRRAEEAGAILVDIEESGIELSGADAYNILKSEFKASLDDYLADSADGVETRSLEDVIAFNEADDRELGLFGHNIMTESQETAGIEDEEYLAARDRVQKAAREDGIDRLLAENEVDFLVAPSFGPAFVIDLVRGDVIGNNAGAGWLAAIAGYPHLTLPMGDVEGLPLGFSVMGTKWEDAAVIGVGAALEDVFPPRLEPSFRNRADDDSRIAGLLTVDS